jgi:hypothetical protein
MIGDLVFTEKKRALLFHFNILFKPVCLEIIRGKPISKEESLLLQGASVSAKVECFELFLDGCIAIETLAVVILSKSS